MTMTTVKMVLSAVSMRCSRMNETVDKQLTCCQTWIQDLLIQDQDQDQDLLIQDQDQDQDSAVSRPRPRPRLAYPRPRPRPRPRLKTYKTNTGSP